MAAHRRCGPCSILARKRCAMQTRTCACAGIKTENIIEGGRRARQRVNYSEVVAPKYEELDEDSSEVRNPGIVKAIAWRLAFQSCVSSLSASSAM